MKTFLKWTLRTIIFLIIVILIVNLWVEKSIQSKTFNSLVQIPHNKVGLLLGTSKYTSNGHENLFFKYRIQAASKLFKAKKVEYIIVSGDNHIAGYNEPELMQQSLIKLGVPKERIILDYAGFRTLDSVVRAKTIFGQTQLTIISQKFHNQRAIFISKYKGIDAIGYNADDVSLLWSYRTVLREKLARVKVLFDLIFGVDPKFLGEQIEIR